MHAMGEYIRDGGKIMPAADFIFKIGLSAHTLITSYGDRVRLRADNQGAWHAKGFNTNSLGIEFLVPGIHTYDTFLQAIKQPYLTDKAHAEGLRQVREWIDLHDIKSIDRHSDVDPARKKDPGDGFPWLEFLEDLK